jgi:hypothetical protein
MQLLGATPARLGTAPWAVATARPTKRRRTSGQGCPGGGTATHGGHVSRQGSGAGSVSTSEPVDS